MTNKPMLSVELRALLERVATEADHMLGFTYASNYDECRKAVDELHPFLDNQAAQHQGDKVSIERIDIQMLKGGNAPAAKSDSSGANNLLRLPPASSSSSSASNTSSATQGNIMDQRRANAQRNDYQRQGE